MILDIGIFVNGTAAGNGGMLSGVAAVEKTGGQPPIKIRGFPTARFAGILSEAETPQGFVRFCGARIRKV
jgi:hypothetical protein